MSEYVHEDKTAVHEYVTSPSLDPVTASTPDVHGGYPVNPLGFPNTNVCDGGDRECLGKGNPEFPQSGNFSVEMGGELPDGLEYVEVATNVSGLSGTEIHIPVEYLKAIGNHEYQVTVIGDISVAINTMIAKGIDVRFANAGYDDYSVTGIITTPSAIVSGPEFVDGTTKFSTPVPGCTIDSTNGHVGAGRLAIVIDASQIGYVLLTNQDNRAENGLYKVTGDDEPWAKIASVGRVKGERVTDADDPYNSWVSLDNTPECGHMRHGYSDREVADYVGGKVGELVANAIHPMSTPGDLSGAGQLTRWFVECGDIDLGHSHNGGDPVTVEGFGLGGYMGGECTYGRACPSRRTERRNGIPTEHPVITFSIGTRHTTDEGAAKSTLPLDWPFTDCSEFGKGELDNNITLLKTPAHVTEGLGTVGGLRHEVYGTCPKCGGSGEFEGDECPACDGDGEVVVAHSEANRIHVCVNNDFTPNADDTTTLKRTYVHLPAPINTPDGDELEVTVSLPVVQSPGQYAQNAGKQNLSAYYEYVSSPRVVVLGGYWKFSDTNVVWHESPNPAERPYVTGKIVIEGDGVHPFVDGNGEPLAQNTRIRFTLDGGLNCPRHSDVKGALLDNREGRIVITGLEGYPYTARLRDTRMRICGVAYVGEDDAEYGTGTDLAMGLHARNGVTLGSDSGSGTAGSLNEFNKFIKPLMGEGDTGREGLCEVDARQVVATVYPTTTNTFPWALVGRHKMRHLDRLMTDEWDIGENSISAMIWDSNKKVIDFTDTVGFFGNGNGDYRFTADTMPVRYSADRFAGSADKSVIGSQLRVKLADGNYDDVASNPVRQARKAVSMFADDFRKLRMFHGGKLPKITGACALEVSGEPVDTDLERYFGSWDPQGEPSPDVIANKVASAAWLSKARHLPEYVIVSGQDLSADGNSLIGANPFVDAPVSDRYSAGFAGAKYGNGYYGTKDGHEVIPCEVKLLGNSRAFAYRSVISARVASDPDVVTHELYKDANRVAELQKVSVDTWKDGIGYDITSPYDYLIGGNDYEKWMDIYSATSNVFSIDTVPLIDDMAVPSLSSEQKAMLSGDPMAAYNYESGQELAFTATNLPFYDEGSPRSVALTNMLRKMVSPYGSKMPVRFWDGTRVAIATNGIKKNDIARLTRLSWPEGECDMSPETRSDIIADEFMAKSAGSNTVDVNINYANMESTLHTNWSAPPAKVARNWYEKLALTGTGEFAGPSGYVRVYMKFKFSARAGRWYTVDYRQAPMSYLTPLYGAAALEGKIGGVRIWTESLCAPICGWKDVLMHPYYKYAPMDINPEVMPNLVENAPTTAKGIEGENNADLAASQVSLPRLARPYLPVSDGGLGLNAPCDVNGETAPADELAAMPHANFWSVRKHLRPAVSVMDGTDIPGFRLERGADGKDYAVLSRTGGTMGDAVLWGQFDFPKKGRTVYSIPPDSFDGDKLILSTGEYVSMSDGSLVELR